MSNPGEEFSKQHVCVWDYSKANGTWDWFAAKSSRARQFSRKQSAATYPADRRSDQGLGIGSALYKAAALHLPSTCSGAIL
nr:unnamed protein product [Haemonchus contortus]